MSKYLCEFDLEAEVYLPLQLGSRQIELPSGHTLAFENGPPDSFGHIASLIATVVGEASSLAEAPFEHRALLARTLDVVAYLSHACVSIRGTRRAIEWDAGLTERRFILFGQVNGRYPPSPHLDDKYLQTSNVFDRAPGYVLKALRHFRRGLLEDAPEDQFVRLWLALEILAVNSYDHSQRPPITCRECGKEARCAHCSAVPPRMQSSKVPIETLVKSVVGKKAEEVYSKLFKIRNGLMHGGDASSVAAAAGVSWERILQVLGKVTWSALKQQGRIVVSLPQPVPAFAGDFMRKNVTVVTNGTLPTPDGRQPSIEGFRAIKMTVTSHLDPAS